MVHWHFGKGMQKRQRTDEWYRIRRLFQLFNENMESVFVAGDSLAVDESMSRWLGSEHHVPQVTKMKLKPEGVGFIFVMQKAG